MARRGTARPEGGTRGGGRALPRPNRRCRPGHMQDVSFFEARGNIVQAEGVQDKVAGCDKNVAVARRGTAKARRIWSGERNITGTPRQVLLSF